MIAIVFDRHVFYIAGVMLLIVLHYAMGNHWLYWLIHFTWILQYAGILQHHEELRQRERIIRGK